MKKLLTGFVACLCHVSFAHATCSDASYTTQLATTVAIKDVLNNKRIEAVAPGGEEWNEDHCDTGALYKVGSQDSSPKYPNGPPIDPRAYRGTWGPTGDGTEVNYDYGPSSSFNFTLWKNSTGGLCWENASGIVATTVSPSAPGDIPSEDISTCDAP